MANVSSLRGHPVQDQITAAKSHKCILNVSHTVHTIHSYVVILEFLRPLKREELCFINLFYFFLECHDSIGQSP